MNIVTIFIGHALCACATKKKKNQMEQNDVNFTLNC